MGETVAGSAVVLAAYAIGCFVAGWYLVRLRTGADLRAIGTGSTGGRNVRRALGTRWAIVASSFDVAKGIAAAALAGAALVGVLIHLAHRGILGLFQGILRIGLERGYDFALKSGRPANMRLYRALGFRPFGPLTGSAEAPFQPMYATAKLFALAQGRGRIVAALPEMLGRMVRQANTEDRR